MTYVKYSELPFNISRKETVVPESDKMPLLTSLHQNYNPKSVIVFPSP